jgi:hypothetical protein
MFRIAFDELAFSSSQTSDSTPGLSNPEFEAVLSLPKTTDTSLVTMFPSVGPEDSGLDISAFTRLILAFPGFVVLNLITRPLPIWNYCSVCKYCPYEVSDLLHTSII